jgi:hypothetical protein
VFLAVVKLHLKVSGFFIYKSIIYNISSAVRLSCFNLAKAQPPVNGMSARLMAVAY